jgi:hypothetical protein
VIDIEGKWRSLVSLEEAVQKVNSKLEKHLKEIGYMGMKK